MELEKIFSINIYKQAAQIYRGSNEFPFILPFVGTKWIYWHAIYTKE